MAKTVGLIGVGNMGGAMAHRLLDLGVAVHVRDIDPRAEQPLALRGANVVPNAAAAAAACDVLSIVVVDAPQVEAVLFGEAGPAVEGMRSGQVVMLHSTIAPAETRRFAAGLAARGARVLDAPISGGPARARDGTLSMMVAGGDAAFDAARGVLEALTGRVFRVGAEPGLGATMKLVNNLLAGVHLAAAAEAFALGESCGLDPRTMRDVIGASSGQSWMLDDRSERVLAGDTRPRAHAHILAKDMRLALELAAACGSATPLGAAASARFAAAIAAGRADADDSVLFELARGAAPGGRAR
jgi:3-hydroxyisobutyrate dehydrogenase